MREQHRGGQSGAEPLVRAFAFDDLVTLRQEVRRFAQDNGLSHAVLYRFVLAVHEIATNAVRHGGGHGRLELWRMSDYLRCRVSDRGPGMPHAERTTRPAIDAPNGRGLWLAQHATNLTLTSDNHGTTVTLTCPIPA